MSCAPALLVTLALSACAGVPAEAPRAQDAAGARAARGATERASSGIGPPGARGLSLRRVDRSNSAEPPIALY